MSGMIHSDSNFKYSLIRSLILVMIPLLLANLTLSEYGSLISNESYFFEDAEGVPENEPSETDFSQEEYLLQLSITLSKSVGQKTELVTHLISEWMDPVSEILTPPPKFS